MISIILPVHNGEITLDRTLKSIFAQTFQEFELIIVLDNSTDSSSAICRSYMDSRIRVFEVNFNNLSKSLNFAIEHCKFELIARIDHDDLMHHTRLERQYDVFKNKMDVQICSTWALKIDENDKVCGYLHSPIEFKLQKLKILFENPFIHSSFLFRKKFLQNLNYYDQTNDFYPVEDFKLWSDCILKFQEYIYVIPEHLTYYRVTENSLSWDNKDLRKSVQKIIRQNLILFFSNNLNHSWADFVSNKLAKVSKKNKLFFLAYTVLVMLKLLIINNFNLKCTVYCLFILLKIHLPYSLIRSGNIFYSRTIKFFYQ